MDKQVFGVDILQPSSLGLEKNNGGIVHGSVTGPEGGKIIYNYKFTI